MKPKGTGVPQSGGSREDFPGDRRVRRVQQSGGSPGRRAVVLVPEGRDRERWIRVCGAFVLERRYRLVAVVARPIDAFFELVHDRADVVVVLREGDLWPLVESVANAGTDDDPHTRRAQRTGRVYPRGDDR